MTNDGATILKSIHVDNAAAKVIIDISKTQDDEVGDGTTSVAVLAGELLREAEKLVNLRVHPMTIVDGWREATKVAKQALDASSMDHSADPEAFKQDLLNIARTTLSSKLLTHEKIKFGAWWRCDTPTSCGRSDCARLVSPTAQLAVDAVTRIASSLDLERIQIIKKPGGSLSDSYLDDGFLLDKAIGVGQPKRIEGATIMVANTSMDTDKVKIFGSRVRVDSMAKVAEIEAAEKSKMRAKCQKIIDHGINVFINRQLIYNLPEQIFASAGVMAIEHADFVGVERLAAVTGAEIVSTFDHPELTTLGRCDLIEEVMIGEDRLIRFSGVAAGEACTVVLRGASTHLLDEAERSLHDALCVLQQTMKNKRTIYGGGCGETLMANAVEDAAKKVPGKKQLAMLAFAAALRQLPTIVADNAGLDSADLVTRLKSAHYAGDSRAGLDVRSGSIGDMKELGIMEALKLKQSVLVSAAEAAEMILRVDDIIKCAPRQRRG